MFCNWVFFLLVQAPGGRLRESELGRYLKRDKDRALTGYSQKLSIYSEFLHFSVTIQ